LALSLVDRISHLLVVDFRDDVETGHGQSVTVSLGKPLDCPLLQK
ncbi:MAG: hypothetical protein RLZ37_1709, partial [Actinomycetota bacterium]